MPYDRLGCRKWTAALREEFRLAWNSDRSIAEIARQFGIGHKSAYVVASRLRREGAAFDRRHGRRYVSVPLLLQRGCKIDREVGALAASAAHPIVFSGPMVRAILDGSKTQTRRVVKPQPRKDARVRLIRFNGDLRLQELWPVPKETFSALRSRCPYGQPGHRLWVRETAWYGPQTERVEYDADFDDAARATANGWGAVKRPSIHMPRRASRIVLEVVNVRVERLQEISEEDANAEGCEAQGGICSSPMEPVEYDGITALQAFADLWYFLNAKRGHPWESNPWVWVVEFEVCGP